MLLKESMCPGAKAYIIPARGNGKSESMRRYLEQEINKIKNDENNGGVDMKSAYCGFCVYRRGYYTCEECRECNGYTNFIQDTNGNRDYCKTDVRGPEAAYRLKPGCITVEHLIEKVIFNDPATIIIWKGGRKTVVKAQNGEPFDPEKGMAMAIAKYVMGNKGAFNNVFDKWCAPYYEQQELKAKTEKLKKHLEEELSAIGSLKQAAESFELPSHVIETFKRLYIESNGNLKIVPMFDITDDVIEEVQRVSEERNAKEE